MDKPELVIFDCDGVLVDSEVTANTIMAKSLSAHGFAVTTNECMGLFVGGTLPGTKVKAEQLGAKLPDDWVEVVYQEVYAALRNDCPLIEGVIDVLNALDTASIPYCVASNGRHDKMEITLGQHGLLERFGGRIYSAQELATAKPAPDLFWHAAKGVPLENCVVVEDSANGVRGAKAAGIRCFAYAPEGDHGLKDEGAVPFARMAELPALLGIG